MVQLRIMWNNSYQRPRYPTNTAPFQTTPQTDPSVSAMQESHQHYNYSQSPGPDDWAKLAQNWRAQRTSPAFPQHSYHHSNGPEYMPPFQQRPYMEPGPNHHPATGLYPPPFSHRSPSAPFLGPQRYPGRTPSQLSRYFPPNYLSQPPPPPMEHATFNQPHMSSYPQSLHDHRPAGEHIPPHYPPAPPQQLLGEFDAIPPPPMMPTPQYATFVPHLASDHFAGPSPALTSLDSPAVVYDHEHGHSLGYPVPLKMEPPPPPIPPPPPTFNSYAEMGATQAFQSGRRLPSWLREELEKLESKKRQEQMQQIDNSTTDVNGEVDIAVVMDDARDSADDEHVSDRSPSPRRSPEDMSNSHSPTPHLTLRHLSEEERMEEEIYFIRTTLTELLLQTTQEMINEIVRTVLTGSSEDGDDRQRKSRASGEQEEDEDKSSPLIGGLVAYDSADEDDEEAQPRRPAAAKGEQRKSEPLPSLSTPQLADRNSVQVNGDEKSVLRDDGDSKIPSSSKSIVTSQSPSQTSSSKATKRRSRSRDSGSRKHDSHHKKKRKYRSDSSSPARSSSTSKHSEKHKKRRHSRSRSRSRHRSDRHSRDRGSSRKRNEDKEAKKRKEKKKSSRRSRSRSSRSSSRGRRHHRKDKERDSSKKHRK